jgi:hypothetical protein
MLKAYGLTKPEQSIQCGVKAAREHKNAVQLGFYAIKLDKTAS